MKKLLTLLATLAVAVSLSMPAFASGTASGQESSTQTAKKHKKEKKSKKSKKSKKNKKHKKSKKQSEEGAGQ